MRKKSSIFAKIILALMIPCMFSLTSCSEDVVEPSSNMPPKHLIRTPPRKA